MNLARQQLGFLLFLLISTVSLLLVDRAKGCHPAYPIGISPYVGGPVGVVNPNDWATVKPQVKRVKRSGGGDEPPLWHKFVVRNGSDWCFLLVWGTAPSKGDGRRLKDKEFICDAFPFAAKSFLMVVAPPAAHNFGGTKFGMFVAVISRNSSWGHRQIWLVLSTLLPFVGGQRMDEAEGEGLKAQLLTNLNKYSGHGSRAAEGPMESLGASHGAPGSPMSPLPAELPADPISSLLALFRPPPSFAVLPLAPLIPQTPATFAPPFTANFQQILPKNRPPPPALSERRFFQQKSSTSPAAFSPRSFPIGELKTEKGKWNRTAAEVIGEWRRRMYKVLKSARKQRSREKKANNRESENISAVEEQQHHRHEHHQQRHQQPLMLFGPPPSVIDMRRANKLAKLFGVENAHNGTTRRGVGTVPLRKNLRSSELRTMDGGRRTATLPPPPRGDEGDADLYTDLLDVEEEQKHPQDADGGNERFEIVYVPALKTKRKLLKAKTTTSDGQTEESAEQTKRQKAFGPFNGQTPRTSLFPSSTPDTVVQAAPNVPQLPQPNAVADPPLPPPAPPTVPMLPLAVPSGLLPLQFPTLLPPIAPSLTVVPPPPVQLSGRIAKPSPYLTTLSSLPQSPEGDYLKELENVSEDYVDEQERRLPCLRDRSDAAFPSGGGRPFLYGSNPPGCQKTEKAAIGREFAVKTPSTGLFFEAPEDSSGGAPIRHILWDENKEMCNSARLRALIQKSVVPSNVEKSKRRLQQSAEQQFGTFYNVICGTGFFSYIAHTDEFCLMAVQDMNCYVFSPVCSTQLAIASGISSQKEKKKVFAGHRHLYYSGRRLRAFLNRN
uniref:Ground-like domain-containing protein n=1 Tax=Globodera rostochiensis TaxID=31243 RepID=A0A914HCZ6_GLORO